MRVGGFGLFAQRTALLRVEGDWEQSAVNPVRECTCTKGEQAETSVRSALMRGNRKWPVQINAPSYTDECQC